MYPPPPREALENVATMYYLMDIIPWVTQLNSIFQKEDLDVSIIQASISTTLTEIAKVKEGSGYYTKKVNESLKQDESWKWHMGAGGHEISYSETQKGSGYQKQRCLY